MEENDLYVDNIGYIAQLMDTEMTIFERMKIKRQTLKKITGAIGIYFLVMSLFAYLL